MLLSPPLPAPPCVMLAAAVAAAAVAAAGQETRSYLRQVFDDRLDADGDGRVSRWELRRFHWTVDADSLSGHAADEQRFFAEYDADGDGGVTYAEFRAAHAGGLDALPRLLPSGTVAPEQIHLQLPVTPASAPLRAAEGATVAIEVLWAGGANSSGVVRYGTSKAALTRNVTGAAPHTYTVPQTVLKYTSAPLHKAVLRGLTPGAMYYYQVGDAAAGDGGMSDVAGFRAPRPRVAAGVPPPAAGPRVAVYGDMGTVIPYGDKVVAQVVGDHAADPFDAVFHVGDLAYAGVSSLPPLEDAFLANIAAAGAEGLGRDQVAGGAELETVWDTWMNQIAPIASQVPYMASVGNHEKFYDFAAYRNRFPAGAEVGGDGNFWFAFDIDHVHFVAMSMQNEYGAGTEQYGWLDAELGAAAARKRELAAAGVPSWLVLGGHRPPLCTDSNEADQHMPGSSLLATIEPLMVKHGVDLILTGHQHVYERVHPSLNGSVPASIAPGQSVYDDPPYAVQVVQGTGGCFVDGKSAFMSPSPAWSAVRSGNTYGYGALSVNTTGNSTSLHYAYHKRSNGAVVDEFWIHKHGGAADRYSCGPTGTCVKATTGHASRSKCEATCNAPRKETRYVCGGYGECYQNVTGHASLDKCEATCLRQ